MPATDPINPNVHPLIYRLNTIYGQAQAAALEAEGKDGIIFNATYTNFWEGAMAWAGWWHNEVGLLTEVASARIATPVVQTKADPNKPARTASCRKRGRGGEGFNSDRGPSCATGCADGYFPAHGISAAVAGRNVAAARHRGLRNDGDVCAAEHRRRSPRNFAPQYLRHQSQHDRIGKKGELGFEDKDKSFAAIIPVQGQHDPNEVIDLVDKLKMGGVEVSRATKEFKQDGETYAAGTYVIPFTQVFARYAKDMLEKQTYPEVRRAPNAPAEAPYDVSAWSLGMQFGVKTIFAKTALPADLAIEPVSATPKFILDASNDGDHWTFPYTGAESAVVINRLLKSGASVSFERGRNSSAAIVHANATREQWSAASAGFEIRPPSSPAAAATHAQSPASASSQITLRAPRVGLYQSWTANMDEGWTRWVFDHYEFPYKILHNADIQSGNLRANFDAILIPDQTEQSLMEGQTTEFIVPEYRGGIGAKGWQALSDFMDQGGTVIALGGASHTSDR